MIGKNLHDSFFKKKETIEKMIIFKITNNLIQGWEQKNIFPVPENHDKNIKDKLELRSGWLSIMGVAMSKIDSENISIVRTKKSAFISPYDVSLVMNKLKVICEQFNVEETEIVLLEKRILVGV